MAKITKKFIILLFGVLILSGCTSAQNSDDTYLETEINNSDSDLLTDDLSDSYSIRLTSPQKDQVLKSPFLVAGEANLPNDIIYVRVKNPSGDIVIEEQSRVKEGTFGVLLRFLFQATDSGTVEIYGIDSNTGKEVSSHSVEVNFDISSNGNTQNPL